MATYNGWMGAYHVPDIDKQLSQLVDAADTFKTNRQNKAIGEAAASGRLSDAAGVAFKQGNVKTGLALKDLDNSQQERIRNIIGQAALNADTPEKWAQLQQTVARRFPGEELEPFEQREGIVSMFRDFYKDRDDARADRAQARADRAEARDERRLALDEQESAARLGGGGLPKLSVTEKKEIFDAEDSANALDHTIANLEEALKLSEQAYDGTGAGAAATIGAKIPGGGMVFDKDKAEATLAYEKIMTPEALSLMAQTLKGATTDQEMNKYIGLISDPSTPKAVRKEVINRLITLSASKRDLARGRASELRSGKFFVPGNEAPAKPAADPLGIR